MKKTYKRTVFCILCLCAIPLRADAVSGGPAFESLAAIAGGIDPALAFDGALIGSELSLPVATISGTVHSAGGLAGGSLLRPVPMPVAEQLADKARLGTEVPLDAATERPAIDRALKKLAAVKSGKDLAAFMDSEGVEIKWRPLSELNSYDNYAMACRPEVCGDKKVIFLNNNYVGGFDYKSLFLDVNPTFLAVTLAHELMHLSDLKDNGAIMLRSQANFFTELNATSAGTYVYHQLLISGVAPKPNSAEESYELQMIRLNLAIRDYVNGGKRPVSSDFSKLVRISDLDFDRYVGNVTDTQRKGSMSLAGVVERIYGYEKEMENLQKPPSSASGAEKKAYKQSKNIKKSLDLSTAGYIKWRKVTVDAPPPPPVQPHNPWHHQPGGDDDGGSGGGNDGGAIGIDVDDWHPTPGSGGATWD